LFGSLISEASEMSLEKDSAAALQLATLSLAEENVPDDSAVCAFFAVATATFFWFSISCLIDVVSAPYTQMRKYMRTKQGKP
jgi:hypothetical protein